MALPTKTITFDNLNASTTSDYLKVLADNFFNKRPFHYLLNKKKKTYTGGVDIITPLIYAQAGNGGSYNGYQSLTTNDTEQITSARYHPAHYYTNVVISQTDMETNRGNTAVFNLVEAKYKIAEMTLDKLINDALLGSGTASPNAIGIRTYLPTSANTVGGIDATVETWWDNNRYNGTSLATLTMAKLQSAWGEVSDGNVKPTCLVTEQAVYDKIWSLADAKQRLGVEELVKLGFSNIEFNGVPIIVDKAITAGTGEIYFLNLDYLYLKVSDQDSFKAGEWLMNTNQLAKVQYITWTGQMICDNRRYQSVMYNLT